MKKIGRGVEDLIPTDLTVSSFSGAITKTHGILPLEVDLGSKQIMLAFFVVDCTSTYEALLGRDWIHQSLAIHSTLHQQVAIYHEADTEGPGFWEMVEAESRPFFPTANVAEASFYNPNVGILQCSGADENGRITKLGTLTIQDKSREEFCGEELDVAIRMAECIYDLDGSEDLPESPKLVEFLCAEPDKPPPEVHDHLEVIDLGTEGDPRPIQISGLLKTNDRAKIVCLLQEFEDCFAWHYTEMPSLYSTLVEHKMPINEG
ncbi:hypothetical protein ACFX2G_040938 [Malus domestica]